jgi:hypothetical protein
MIFSEWQSRTDALMQEGFALTTIEAGLDETELNRHYLSSPDPAEFVRWFGEKYDLISVSDWTAFR